MHDRAAFGDSRTDTVRNLQTWQKRTHAKTSFFAMRHAPLARAGVRIRAGNGIAAAVSMTYDEAKVDALRGTIIGCAIEVHRRLGPGLLESVYQMCLGIELANARLRVERNRAVPLVYRGHPLTEHLFIDLLVDDLIVVEVKAVFRLAAVHSAQVITYLKLADKPAGLLLNFNCALMKNGTRRLSHPDVLKARSPRDSRTTLRSDLLHKEK